MAGSYELWLTTDTGVRIAQLDYSLGFTATRVANGIGRLEIELPITFDDSILTPDKMIHVLRRPSGGRLSLWRPYFVRRWKFAESASGETIRLFGADPNELLSRRIVAAFSGTSYSTKSAAADDMMKEIVTEAVSDSAEPTPSSGTREWNNFSIAPDVSLGADISDSFSFDRLSTDSGSGTLASLAAASKVAGVDLYYDVEVSNYTEDSIAFEFRTHINQPALDVSDSVVFSAAAGNLSGITLDIDYSREVTVVYGGGQEEGTRRVVVQVSDSDRSSASVWNRRELFVNASNRGTSEAVREAARTLLRSREPVIRFAGTPHDTKGTRFGVDWDWGYKVTARHRRYEFGVITRAVAIGVAPDGGEVISANLGYESE